MKQHLCQKKQIKPTNQTKKISTPLQQTLFPELTIWLKNFTKPTINKMYTQQQIYQLMDFIEVSYGIKLRKKTNGKFFQLRCHNCSVCQFSVIFQKIPLQKGSRKQKHFKIHDRLKKHPNNQQFKYCLLPELQFKLFQRKKYLNLINETLRQIIESSQLSLDEIQPTWVMKELEQLKNQPNGFLYQQMDGIEKRQLSKKFDNIVGNIKKSIKQERKQIQAHNSNKENHYQKRKTKKIKKSNKTSLKFRLGQLKQKEQQHQKIQKVSPCHMESENQDKLEEMIFEENSQHKMKQDLEKQMNQIDPYSTPTKKIQKPDFNLEKSSSNRLTLLQASYRQYSQFENMKKRKFKVDFDEDKKPDELRNLNFSNEQKEQKIEEESFWQVL